MYLGVHYPTDVLAGAVIGAGSAWLMYKANRWLFRKKPGELQPAF
jgi:undecaprenyl-diphosphatase